ncbi:non-specific lipid-transfer protein 2-like [Amaranthus tricolor]|uniref:non-specific lipid-transfer protein 2-like n=1 Tax=Amaranthus tricolor TaxID=29722 RepID=UPI0025857DC1|nr:non-specific lipid-transfer protein 2-like [Amaranthus tricolor]
MANKAYTLALIAMVVATMLVIEAPTPSMARTKCDITELIQPCAGSFLYNNVPPSKECCNILKAQKSCLCQYKSKYEGYAGSPSAKRVVSACKVKVSC